MAKIIPSSLVSTISGAIEGVIFRRSSSGLVVCHRPRKIGPASSAQTEEKEAFRKALTFWSRMSETDRMAWTSAAASFSHRDRLGQSRRLSGKQLFIKQAAWNGGTVYAGQVLPPTVTTPPFSALSISFVGGLPTIIYSLASDPGVNVRVKARGFRPGSFQPINSIPKWTALGLQTGSHSNTIAVPSQTWPGEQAYTSGEYMAFKVSALAYGHWLGTSAQIVVMFP
jgi:hypothetical protein